MLWRYLRSSFLFWWSLPWSAIGLVLVSVTVWQFSRYSRNTKGFYETTGTVASKYHQGRSNDPMLDVGYIARDGRPHEAQIAVSRSDYPQYSAGSQVRLDVSQADPDDAWLESDGPPSPVVAYILGALSLVFVIPGPLVLFAALRGASRRVRALQTGQYVAGHVEAVMPSNVTVNNERMVWVVWSWTGFDGVRREGRSPPMSPARAKAFEPGGEIAVYMDPTDPTLAEADVYGLRENKPV
jgi:hypothetical protein